MMAVGCSERRMALGQLLERGLASGHCRADLVVPRGKQGAL